MRRVGSIIGALAFTLALFALLHGYVISRLVLAPSPPEPWRTVGVVVIVTLAAAPFVRRLAAGALSPPVARLLSHVSSIWFGFFWLLLSATFLTDLGLGLAARAGWLDRIGLGFPAVDRWRAAAVLGFAIVATALGRRVAYGEPRRPRVDVRLARLGSGLDGLRVVQVSDVHIGSLLGREFAESLVERVNALEPDLVAITGDLVDGSVERLREAVAPLAGLRARYGLFYVTGNHDRYADADAWVAHLATLGVRALRGERVTIERDGASLDVAGVDDEWGSRFAPGHRSAVESVLAGRAPDRPVILLAHNPAAFARASELGVDLQLSGHTHGGQIWPFGWIVWIFHPWLAGLYDRRGSQIYVSRGTGFWGPPVRFLAPPEITEIVLRSAA